MRVSGSENWGCTQIVLTWGLALSGLAVAIGIAVSHAR